MAPVTTPAIILGALRYSDTSKIVRLATRDLGIRSALAKGALRPKSRFGASLQLLSEGVAHLYLKDTRDLQTLAAFDLTHLRAGLAADLPRFAAAAAIGEVAWRFSPAESHPDSYDLLSGALSMLETAPSEAIEVLALRMLWRLISVLGFAPALERCARDGTPLPAEGPLRFSAAEGGGLCTRCGEGQGTTLLSGRRSGRPRGAGPRRRGPPGPGRSARGGASTADRTIPAPSPVRGGRHARARLLGRSNLGRRVIIGTAGHIDHGKSALVEALTGRRMDRLAEEQARGITIDLNFAPLRLVDGVLAGVVDVPGHEDFVRTMVAGAAGMDVVLLVVAADEGIMPQTREHLAIVEALGVPRGVPVLTKCDLVDPRWLALLRDEVDAWLSASPVEFSAALAVSVRSGVGVEALRAELGAVCRPCTSAERGGAVPDAGGPGVFGGGDRHRRDRERLVGVARCRGRDPPAAVGAPGTRPHYRGTRRAKRTGAGGTTRRPGARGPRSGGGAARRHRRGPVASMGGQHCH